MLDQPVTARRIISVNRNPSVASIHHRMASHRNNMNGYANILEFQTWIVYQRVAIDCASCLCE